MAAALELAAEIAARSPVAVQGTKANLIYSRDHSVDEGLNYMVKIILFFLTTLFDSAPVFVFYQRLL